MSSPNDEESPMDRILALWEEKKAEGWTQQQLGEAMGYPPKSARKSVNQFLKSTRPQLATIKKFLDAVGVSLPALDQPTAATMNAPASDEKKPRELPFDPIRAALNTHEHARRTIIGVIESYNSNYDAIAEAVQNSMDALEDAFYSAMLGPFLLEITIDLKANSVTILDTGVGMSKHQVCEAFAPSSTFKDVNYAQSIIGKRGNKYNYRGYKGVGLTFLAYGTDEILIQSIRDGECIKGRMRLGRQWAEGKLDQPPLLEKDDTQLGLEKQKRGTALRFFLSAATRPQALSNLGTSVDVWETIIRTRTAAGQVLLGRPAPVPVKVKLNVINSKGGKESRDLNPEFYYPHLVKGNPEYRFLDVWEYHKKNPSVADHPPTAKRQDGVYLRWSTDDIRAQLGGEKESQFREEINAHHPELYAFRPYHGEFWTELNKTATGQLRTHYFSGGLVVAVDRQRLADIVPIKATRWEYVAANTFVLFHFDKARPDLGRKTLQPNLMDLAHQAADAVVHYMASQTALLKPAGEKSTSMQRQVELSHEDWTDNVRAHQRTNPLSLPPISYVSEPLTEQDVIGLFNQLCALGLFPGMQIFATSASHTYDCYVKFDYTGDMAKLRYKSINNNPLSLSNDVLGSEEKRFQTKGLTLEFKNNLEGFISDVEDETKRKTFSRVDVLVCWGAIAKTHKSYHLAMIDEGNLYERRYPGVTHLLRREGESSHAVQVVMLEHIVRQIQAGHIRLTQK